MTVVSFKCPNCDGELVYDPETAKYKCEYCNSIFDQDVLSDMMPGEGQTKESTQENTQEQTGEQNREDEGTSKQSAVVYSCPSCGAQIVTEETTAATFCYYCHNPVILQGRLDGDYHPDGILPFTISKEKAKETFLQYIKKKWFVPRGFFSERNLATMTGVYFPYWLYDAKLEGGIEGEGQKVRVWVHGDTEYTETKIYRVVRRGEAKISHMPENALQKADARLAEGVLPYPFEQLEPFDMGYLSGFMAEKRDVESDAITPQLRQQAKEDAEHLFREDVQGYTGFSVRQSDFSVMEEHWNYVLLPVWTLTYQGRDGKIYYFSMNGRTGQVSGELPVDGGRLALMAAIVFAIVGLIGLLIGWLI